MWRPEEGWVNPYANDEPEFQNLKLNRSDIFEAGADAMLEALRKMPYCTNPVLLPDGNYYLIPDDK